MITDQQVRRLAMLMKRERNLARAASKAGMDEKTGRKYLKLGKLPSQCKKEHTWKTRNDPFEGAWSEIREYLENNPGFEAKTLFEFLQRKNPGKFSDGQLNAGRQKRLDEEIQVLKMLPGRKLDDCKKITIKVGPSSTIRVLHNTYSVDRRLIREYIQIWAYSNQLEVWYGQKQIDVLPRLRGESKHAIQYRHIIDWLVRKPGAFEQYKYRQDLFPSTTGSTGIEIGHNRDSLYGMLLHISDYITNLSRGNCTFFRDVFVRNGLEYSSKLG